VGAANGGELRIDHVLAWTPEVRLLAGRTVGAAAAPSEWPDLMLVVLDSGGRVRAVQRYDLAELDRARAYFERLTLAGGNAAWRTAAMLTEAMNRRDEETLAASYAPTSTAEDRRSAVGPFIEADRESWRAALRLDEYAETRELLATTGDHLVLTRALARFRSGESGSAEIETLGIVEVDDDGRLLREVWFNPDDIAAAQAELDGHAR
jgi:hypothetical protein